MMISVLDREENIAGKGENAGFQHFLLFLTMFSVGFFCGTIKNKGLFKKGSNLPQNHRGPDSVSCNDRSK